MAHTCKCLFCCCCCCRFLSQFHLNGSHEYSHICKIVFRTTVFRLRSQQQPHQLRSLFVQSAVRQRNMYMEIDRKSHQITLKRAMWERVVNAISIGHRFNVWTWKCDRWWWDRHSAKPWFVAARQAILRISFQLFCVYTRCDVMTASSPYMVIFFWVLFDFACHSVNSKQNEEVFLDWRFFFSCSRSNRTFF